jgi:hypothetical protein
MADATAPEAFEPPIAIKAASFETDFPAAIAHQLSISPGGSNIDERGTQNTLAASAEARTIGFAKHEPPTKILTFELEPASLGAVAVRMKIMRSRVELQINVETADALSLLTNCRDKLSQAIGAGGHEVASVSILVSSAPANLDTIQSTANHADAPASSDWRDGGEARTGGRDGMANGRGGAPSRSSWSSEDSSRDQVANHGRVSGPGGVYL